MKGLKMAARKTITYSQSPHTYTLWQIRQRQNQWDQATTCTAIAQQVYLNQLLVLQQKKKTKKKNTCDVYNNKVPSKQGEILQREGQILLVEEVHDHPDNNTIGAILVQVFWGFEVFTYPSEMVRDMEHTHTQELKMWWNDPAERLFNAIYLINNQKIIQH